MKFIEPTGEQKIECKECRKAILDLYKKYDINIAVGEMLKSCASCFLLKDNPKEWFMETCLAVFDEQSKSYQEFRKIDKKSKEV